MYLYNMKCYKFARLKIQEMQVGIQCKVSLHSFSILPVPLPEATNFIIFL